MFSVRLACYISFSLFNDARCQNCPISNLNRLQFADGLFLCSVRHALDYKEPTIASQHHAHGSAQKKLLPVPRTALTNYYIAEIQNYGQLSTLINTAN